MLYTQFQDINARAVAPMQDTPSLKYTYGACITVQNVFDVIMTAKSSQNITDNDTFNTYCFEQTNKVASYMITVVIGNFVTAKISPTVTLWAENQYALDAAELAFLSIDQYITAVTFYVGLPLPYDMLNLFIVPANYPYAGMEGPDLTFYSEALLTPGRELNYNILYFLAAQYTGNVVTCANWESFWVSAGLSTFIQR